jgi:hypothetical protein
LILKLKTGWNWGTSQKSKKSKKENSMASFLSDIETIGKHIAAGVEKVAPLVAKLAPTVSLVPVVGPILSEVGVVITELEHSGATLTSTELETLVQTIAGAAHLKVAAGVTT